MSRFLADAQTPRELEDALAAARDDDVAALAAVESAKDAYEAGLLSVTPDQLRELDEARSATQRLADVSRAKIADLDRRHKAATAPEVLAAQKKRRADAVKKSTEVRALVETGYPAVAERLRDMLRLLATAQASVELSNADPSDEPRLPDVEAFRSTPIKWAETVSEAPISMWAAVGSQGTPLAEDLQSQVEPAPGRGSPEHRRNIQIHGQAVADDLADRGRLQTSPHDGIDVVLRTFRRREVLPETAAWRVPDLADDLYLPPLIAGDSPYFAKIDGVSNPARVIEQLDKPRLTRPKQPERAPVIQYV